MTNFKSVKMGKFFVDLRRMNRWNQEELEFLTELDRRTISNIENDITKPSLETLVKIAHAFQMRPSELMLEIEEKTNLLEWLKQLDSKSE